MQLAECLKICCQHHVHCTQHMQKYRNTTWWIQPAQRRALDTTYVYTAHNTEIQHGGNSLLEDGLLTPCTYIAHNTEIQKYNMVDTACSKTGSQHHVHCTHHRDTEIQHAYGGYSLLKDGLSTPCTLHTTQRYRNTTWWIQPAQRRALGTMYIAHNTKWKYYNNPKLNIAYNTMIIRFINIKLKYHSHYLMDTYRLLVLVLLILTTKTK